MTDFKNLAKENKALFVAWGLLVLMSILNLFNFSFASDKIQYIYYVLYFVTTLILFIIINKKSEFRINQLLIALIMLLAIVVSIKDVLLILPLFLIYPFLSSKNSHWISMILAAFTYLIAILGIMLIVFGRYGFGSTTLIEHHKVPNSKDQISVYYADGGATGGSTITYLDRIYLNIFKHRRIISID